MKIIKKLFGYFIFGNVFISIAAVCFTLETYLLLQEQFRFDGTLSLIFFATFFIYNNHRLSAYKKLQGGSKNSSSQKEEQTNRHCEERSNLNITERLLHYVRNDDGNRVATASVIPSQQRCNNVFLELPYFKNSVLIALLGILISLFFCSFQILLCLIPLGLISFAYSVPVIPNNKGFVRLRELPGLKIIFISLVWTFTTVVIPVMNTGKENIFNHDVLLLFFQRILFIYAITIPFDIKDSEKDRSENVKTIPLMVGEQRAKLSALLALLFFLLITIYQYAYATNTGYYKLIPAFLISVFTTALLIINSSQNRSRYYFLFLLDGTMVLQFFLVFLANYV